MGKTSAVCGYELPQIPEPFNMETGYGFNYYAMTKDDLANGMGLRVVLWTAGCSHSCIGCQNPFTHNPSGGLYFDRIAEAQLWDMVAPDYISGVTFSGGDPLFYSSRKGIGKVIKNLKRTFPGKDIWLYTGYTLVFDSGIFYFTDLKNESFSFDSLSYIDVLVDGPFNLTVRNQDIQNGHDPEWRGSSNQRVIDVPKSLSHESVVLYKPEIFTRKPETLDISYLKSIVSGRRS